MVFIFLIVPIFAVNHRDPKSNAKIFYDLMQTYDKNIRPYYLVKPVDVSVDIYMNAFGSVKADDMSYSVNINLRQRWNDPRLDFSQENTDEGNFTFLAEKLVY